MLFIYLRIQHAAACSCSYRVNARSFLLSSTVSSFYSLNFPLLSSIICTDLAHSRLFFLLRLWIMICRMRPWHRLSIKDEEETGWLEVVQGFRASLVIVGLLYPVIAVYTIGENVPGREHEAPVPCNFGK